MALTNNAISFSSVGQTFLTGSGSVTALDGVTVTIAQHEFVAVLGHPDAENRLC